MAHAHQRAWTIATAESLTAGLVVDALVRVPGASAVVRGGVAAYHAEVKTNVLGVPAEVIARRGVTSREVALAMAHGVVALTASDVGIATTGVAGPGPEQGVPAGTVTVAAVTPAGQWVRSWRVAGTRECTRRAARDLALALALGALGNNHRPMGVTPCDDKEQR
ncbi:CinA family protein [Serinibacter salmoneus]|uniref:CinA family protein n=1 Tax=Serinibacter salmoneus TaxID=556530 RepID=UPI001FE68EDC